MNEPIRFADHNALILLDVQNDFPLGSAPCPVDEVDREIAEAAT